jgi:L-threonylcarbamoyladenylate synthase
VAIVKASKEAIAHAAELLAAGRLVAFPTETVYGLGADATNAHAVAAIFEAKGRPRVNPLIVHVARIEQARALAGFTPLAERLAEAFWPGPLTLVLRRRSTSGIADLATAGLDTIAVRMPDHPVARALLLKSNLPLAAPSANRSGRVSPTAAEHVASDLAGRVDLILDAGRTDRGLESTVLDATGENAVLLRPGSIPTDRIEALLGRKVHTRLAGDTRPTSPGLLGSHYAPRAPVRLNAASATPGEALLAFGPDAPATEGPSFNLSPRGDLVEAAANLFAALRALDSNDVTGIAVMPIPETGLGEAINDRLRRAAAPR